MSVNQRVKNIRIFYKMSQSAFSELLSVKQATISQVENSKINPSLDLIINIAYNFDDVNREWLLTGKGQMLKTKNESENSPEKKVPVYAMEALATGALPSDMKPIQRILQYIDYKGLKTTPFEKDVGISAGYLKKMLNRNGDIGSSHIQKIIDYCPDLSLEWLISGKGEMLKTKNESENLHEKKVPVYAMEALATGALPSELPREEIEDYISVPGSEKYSGDLLAFRVKGASMSPTIKSGDIILAEKLESANEIKPNYIYVVIAKDGVQTAVAIKRIVASRDGVHLRFTSDNRMFPSFVLEKENILSLWAVRLKLTGDFMNPQDFEQRLSEIEFELQELKAKQKILNK